MCYFSKVISKCFIKSILRLKSKGGKKPFPLEKQNKNKNKKTTTWESSLRN